MAWPHIIRAGLCKSARSFNSPVPADPTENEQEDKLATAAAATGEKAAAEKAEEEEEAKRRRAEQAIKFQMQIDKIEEERGQLSDNTHPEVSRKMRESNQDRWK